MSTFASIVTNMFHIQCFRFCNTLSETKSHNFNYKTTNLTFRHVCSSPRLLIPSRFPHRKFNQSALIGERCLPSVLMIYMNKNENKFVKNLFLFCLYVFIHAVFISSDRSHMLVNVVLMLSGTASSYQDSFSII